MKLNILNQKKLLKYSKLTSIHSEEWLDATKLNTYERILGDIFSIFPLSSKDQILKYRKEKRFVMLEFLAEVKRVIYKIRSRYLKQKYPDSEIISDYGSGLNFHRKGLQKIMDIAYKGELQELVVTYKDRLCRFGFELIEYILKTQSNATIMVLCYNSTSKESELATDLLSIITVFSARMHGLRKYKNQIKEDKSVFQAEFQTEIETDDRII